MRDETRFPWVVLGVAFTIALGFAYFVTAGLDRLIGPVNHQDEPSSISALQDRVNALESRLDEQAEWSRTQDVWSAEVRDRHDATLAQLRLDLDGVLARRPLAAPHDANRHEQRIGNLEYATWGKP